MSDLKEYTIKVNSIGDEIVKWSGGEFIVKNVFDENDKKYGIPKLKKDGTISVAYTQAEKVSVGDSITVAVDEQQKTKEGKTYTTRTIRSIKGDEHGTPYTAQSPQSGTGQQVITLEGLNRELSDIKARVKTLEDANQAEF